MLPRFAARVWSTTVNRTSFSSPHIFRVIIARGTKTIRATSLVITMLKKKGMKTRTKRMPAVLLNFPSRNLEQFSKAPNFLKEAMTAIRQKSRKRVLKSM